MISKLSTRCQTSTVIQAGLGYQRHVQRRKAVLCRAVLSKVPAAPSDTSKKLPVLTLISANVETQAQVQQFEVIAGRSAMIGFLVAFTAELLTEQSIFKTVDMQQAWLYGSHVLAAVLIAAAAAVAVNKQRLGSEIKEAVITSLTAVQRSAASVTGRQVDRAVDYVMSKAFDMSVVYNLLADEDILP